ncbi:hypothetical protein [Parapedobacter koreensis]|uniref:DUF3945 domain-containing protein n=1 Tax=Parapedobacter koreensis TaxID=332977 RepID=A0A1H7FB82_9SPHI|nr:hypothetical protein [Parapedobacter koreensis]SEK23413.1 hypothetical protein SAMN05421740_101295 [Parapedobacter koreensis]
MQLLRNDIAPDIAKYLNSQLENGMKWAVYDTEEDITGAWDITCFRHQRDAHAYVNAGFAEAYYLDVDTIPRLLKQLDEIITNKYQTGILPHQQKEDTMNLNNLEDLKKYLTELKFDPTHIQELEEKMTKGLPAFDITDQYIGQYKGKTGVIDLNLPVRQSNQSENYYMNKFDLTFTKANPLPEGQKYFVITKDPENGKKLFRDFISPAKAIEYLNEKKQGERELVIGTSPKPNESTVLVRKEDAKLIYTAQDFRETYHSKPLTQPFYIQEGKGFTLPEALKLIQGQSLYKENLLTANGDQYKAYVSINRDDPMSTGNGYRYHQFRDPEYGFDIEKTLAQYDIKGIDNQESKNKLIGLLKDGNQVPVVIEKNGKRYDVKIETAPRYKNINIVNKEGQPLRREFFDRNNTQEIKNPVPLRREWDLNQKQGMRL